MGQRAFALMIAILVSFAGGGYAQSPSSGGHPDLSGYWELRFDSFNVPPAALTPQAQMAMETQRKKHLDAVRG